MPRHSSVLCVSVSQALYLPQTFRLQATRKYPQALCNDLSSISHCTLSPFLSMMFYSDIILFIKKCTSNFIMAIKRELGLDMGKSYFRAVSLGTKIFILCSAKPQVSRKVPQACLRGKEWMKRWNHRLLTLLSIRSTCICFTYWSFMKILFEKRQCHFFKVLETNVLGQISVLIRLSRFCSLRVFKPQFRVVAYPQLASFITS